MDRRPTRVVLATSLLATLGVLGAYLPLGIVTLLAGFTSGHGGGAVGLPGLAETVRTYLLLVPFVALVALVAAVGLYQGRGWAAPLGIVIGLILVASAPIRLLVLPPGFDTETPLALAAHHLLLLPALAPFFAPINLLVGGTVVWALVTAWPHASAVGPVSAPVSRAVILPSALPRRIRLAGYLLLILGAGALAPLIAWVAGAVVPWRDPEQSWDIRGGSLIWLTGIIPAVLALSGALAMRAGERRALILGQPAAAAAAPWVGVWALQAAASTVSGDGVSTPNAALLGVLLAVAAALSPLVVLVATLTARRSLDPLAAAETVDRHGQRRWRPASVGMLGSVVLLSALAGGMVAAGAAAPRDPAQALSGPRTVMLGDQEYVRVARLAGPRPVGVPIGPIDHYSDGDLLDQTAYGVRDVPHGLAIIIDEATVERPESSRAVFVVRSSGLDPAAVCLIVDLSDPDIAPEPCGPPEALSLAGRWYRAVPGVSVQVDRLEPLGQRAEASASAWQDLSAFRITGLQEETVIAIRVGPGGRVYRAFDAYDTPMPALCELRATPGDGHPPDEDLPGCTR